MSYLQNLRLGDTRVTDEQHIDVTPVPGAASTTATRNALVRSAEQLQQDSFLHIVHRIDRRGKRPRKQLIDIMPLAQGAQLRLQLLALCCTPLPLDGVLLVVVHVDAPADTAHTRDTISPSRARASVDPKPVICADLDVHNVEECAEEALQRPLARVHAHRHAAEDAGDDKAVTWFRHVDELVVHAEGNGVGRLPVRHGVGGFLKADHLAVRELAAVVHERHGAHRATDVARAASGLVDFPALNLDLNSVVTGEAAEEGDFHVGDHGRCADDQTLDADELVRI